MASLAFSITPLAEIPAMVYLGSFSDRVGHRKVILICLAAYPIRFLLTGFSSNPFYVVITQLLHGLTFGGLYVVSSAYISETVRGKEGFALSLYTISMNVGRLVGNYLLANILSLSNFRIMYFAAALISGFSMPLFLILEWIRRR